MFLAETDIESTLQTLKAAFPHLSEWEYSNEKDGDHEGFAVWGALTVGKGEDDIWARHYYVTFNLFAEKGQARGQWSGSFTIGQHSYFWSDADAGDAFLLDTERYDNLSDAIIALKAQIRDLAANFSAI